MPKTNLELWTEAALALKPEAVRPPNAPVLVLTGEAQQVAQFVEQYWEPTASRPGMKAVAAFLPANLAAEIKSLSAACIEVNTDVALVEVDKSATKRVERARTVTAELGAHLEFVLDDHLDTPSDEILRLMQAREAASQSVLQLVQTLSDFAALARRESAKLGQVGGFDPNLVDEALGLSKTLLELCARPGPKASEKIELRDRLLCLLNTRVLEARRAARFVFRNYPEIQRKVTSAYQRERRASRRQKGEGASENTPSNDA